MSIWGKIFGSQNAIDKTIDGFYKGTDALVFTDEEKSEFIIKILKAYEPFKLIQRILAIIVGVPYVSIWVFCALLYALSVFTDPCFAPDMCKYLQIQATAKEIATLNNQTLGQPFSIIMGLYFFGGALEGGLRARNSKKT